MLRQKGICTVLHSFIEFETQLPVLLPRLWRFALRLTRVSSDAEDLVQRTCLRALEKRQQWQPGTALLSWLFAIMQSVWLNELRAVQRRRESSLDNEAIEYELEESAQTVDPESQMHFRQVIDAVDALPEAQRSVMLLTAVEGLSYTEAASALQIPIGTVMSRLSRARVSIGDKFMAMPPKSAGGRKWLSEKANNND